MTLRISIVFLLLGSVVYYQGNHSQSVPQSVYGQWTINKYPEQHQEGTQLMGVHRLQRHADRLAQRHTAFHLFTPGWLFYD